MTRVTLSPAALFLALVCAAPVAFAPGASAQVSPPPPPTAEPAAKPPQRVLISLGPVVEQAKRDGLFLYSDLRAVTVLLQRQEENSGLRPTEEQFNAIRAIHEEYMEGLRAFMSANFAEHRRLHAMLGNDGMAIVGLPAPSPTMQPPGFDPADHPLPIPRIATTKDFDEALRQARALADSAPRGSEFRARIDAILTDAQRKYVDSGMASRMNNRESRLREQARNIGRYEEALKRMQAIVEDYPINDKPIPDDIKARFRGLSLEDRFLMIQQIERRLKARGGTWDGPIARPSSEPSPAPNDQAPDTQAPSTPAPEKPDADHEEPATAPR